MDTINIGGNTQDRFYRYKMPKLISKIEGKGNGIKTVVPNMTDIARSLSRPPTYPTKFFGCELGAQVKCDEKNDRYIVNGAHDASKLQELLDVFIKKFVLCAGCSNPETDLIITGKSQIIRDCKACGQRTDVDMRHKLVTYILKNPPTSPKGKGGKKERKGKKPTEDENPPSPTKGGSEEGSDDEITRRIQAEASELPTADQNADDDDDWSVDTSADAVKKRIKALEEDVRSSLVIADADGGNDEDEDPYEQIDEWLEENSGSSNNDIYKKIKELGISKDTDRVIKHLLDGLFASSFRKSEVISKKIHKRAKLFKKFVKTPDDQRALLGATEEALAENKGLLESKIICHILMGYYQNDLLEEEVFAAWIEGSTSEKYSVLFKRTGSVNYVDPAINRDIRNKAKPFAEWLENEDDDDDDDDDDDE